MFEQNKTPYRGRIVVIIAMILPIIVCTWMFYSVIMKYQPRFGSEFNYATAKTLGCGIGVLFHFSCWLFGAFSQDFAIVKNRVKEFFSDLSVSPKLAFNWYFEDIKTNGIAYWIYVIIIIANILVFADALQSCLNIMGWKI